MSNSKNNARAERQIEILASYLTGEELVEVGVTLIARGVFRTSTESSNAEAASIAEAVLSTVSHMHLDFLRKSWTA